MLKKRENFLTLSADDVVDDDDAVVADVARTGDVDAVVPAAFWPLSDNS